MLLTKPTLLLDKSKCLRNIERMSTKAMNAGLGFRPHFKTHQSAEIGNWFRDFGVSKITVSSFDMAEYFIHAGWQDILVAFPFNPLEIKRLNNLTSKARMNIPEIKSFLLPLTPCINRTNAQIATNKKKTITISLWAFWTLSNRTNGFQAKNAAPTTAHRGRISRKIRYTSQTLPT